MTCRTQAQTPAISSIMRDRRVQFLPVQWRASLNLDLGEELAKQKEGLDNHFNLEGKFFKTAVGSSCISLDSSSGD